MRAPITVVAAVIEQSGHMLICQRRRGDKFELKWEFPGGKVQTGETPQAALQRELQEELQVSAKIGPELHRTTHRYEKEDLDVELIFLAATLGPETMINRAFERVVWAEPSELPGYDFLPADRELVDQLWRAKPKIQDSTTEKH